MKIAVKVEFPNASHQKLLFQTLYINFGNISSKVKIINYFDVFDFRFPSFNIELILEIIENEGIQFLSDLLRNLLRVSLVCEKNDKMPQINLQSSVIRYTFEQCGRHYALTQVQAYHQTE